jgi:probable F420-dependent oxidoreductase
MVTARHVGTNGGSGGMRFWQSLSFTGAEDLVRLGTTAEEVGFTGVAFADHLVTPEQIDSPYPYTEDGKVWWDPKTHWPDPWMVAAVVASHTTTLQFVTSVFVLPMHELFGVAKSVSTAAYLSDNRVTLGVGVGWMKEEFVLTGQDFHTRGRRADEMLDVIASLCAGGSVTHHGEFYSFDAVVMEPVPSARIPVFVGGESDAALSRAARHDGWFGGGPYLPEQVPPLLRRLEAYLAQENRGHEPYRVMIGLATPPDADTFLRLADEGVTDFISLPWYYSIGPDATLPVKLDSMKRFSEEFIERLS